MYILFYKIKTNIALKLTKVIYFKRLDNEIFLRGEINERKYKK